MAEEGGIGIIIVGQRPGIRQFSGGGYGSADDIGECIAAFLAGLYKLDNPVYIGIFFRKGKVSSASRVDH